MRIAVHPQRACFVQWSALATLGAGLLATSPAAARGAIQYAYDATNQTVELSIEAVFRAPPTTDDLTLIKQEFLEAARIFCDATDGFVRLKQVNLTSGDGAQENGDFWLLPGYGRSNAGDHINLYRDAWNSLVIAHELGHYALGVDDSYPENRRGGGCGIGPSFDADVRLDEVWNSLFQQAGGWWCQDAAGRGLPELDPNWWWQARCRTDADCPHVDDGTGTLVPGVHDPVTGDVIPMSCPASPVRYTELSVVANHDLRRGDGQVACPAPREGRHLVVGATLNPNDAVTAFDPSSFDAAAASVGPYAWAEYEVIDTLGLARLKPRKGSLSPFPSSTRATALGAGADVFNAGSLETNLGTDTLVGNTYSAGDIVARTDAHIQGVAWTSGAFGPQTEPIVDGGVTTGVALTFPDLTDFSVTFPSPAQGDINLQNGESAEPLEGAWGSIRAAEGSTVILNPGAYYIDSLDIEPGAELLVEDAAGPVYVYVQDTLLFKGELNDLGARPGRVFIGYFGESDTVLEAPMRATVVAPYAKVVFSTSLTNEYLGSFFAESLELRPDVTVRHEPFQWSWYAAPESSTCSSGVEDGDETDIDCGGSCAARCDLEQGCGVDGDCAEGACVLGVCTLTPGGCSEAVAVELGAPGESNVVAADGCIMVRDEFPEWWGSRNMQLQSLDGGSYPVPFTWSQSCTGGGGSGAYTGSWQSLTFGPTSAACAVVIDLQGGAGTSVALRYYAG